MRLNELTLREVSAKAQPRTTTCNSTIAILFAPADRLNRGYARFQPLVLYIFKITGNANPIGTPYKRAPVGLFVILTYETDNDIKNKKHKPKQVDRFFHYRSHDLNFVQHQNYAANNPSH